MKNIVKQTIDFYLQKMRAPLTSELKIDRSELLTTKWSCFVTIFLNWEIRGGAWNIKEIKSSIAEELIENTIEAIVWDTRFDKLSIWESKNIKIRVDLITNRKVLARTDEEAKKSVNTLSKIDPVKNWVIVIKKDYKKTATILPNIDPKLISGKDYIWILSAKLWETFNENNYIIYKIDTKVESDY